MKKQGDIVAGVGGVIIDPNNVSLRRYPMAVEFPLGKGKVVYTSFSVEPNISPNSSPEIKTVIRELVAGPLSYPARSAVHDRPQPAALSQINRNLIVYSPH